MSSAVTNGNVELEDDAVPVKSKKARKSMPSGMMVIRKKDWNRNIPDRTVVKGKLSMEKDVEEQIFTGPISPYVPKLQSNNNTSNQDETESLFTCIDCGDKFLFESSLDMHLSRRSVKISMWCPGLSEPKTFYNRCKLLANLRQHMEPSAGVSAKISLHPLEKEHLLLGTKESSSSDLEAEKSSTSINKCKILPRTPATSIQNEEVVTRIPVYLSPLNNSVAIINSNIPSTSKVQSTLKNNATCSKSCEDESLPVLIETFEYEASPSPLRAESDEIMDVETNTEYTITDKCPECNIKLPSGTDLKQHFAGLNIKSSNFKCKKCNILLPTSCSLKCHEHLHSSDYKEENNNNFICPECGIKFEKWESYFKHLHNDCMHAYYSECFKCQNCSNMFPTSISLEVHILNNHMKKIFKCGTCNIAFYSNDTLKKHYDDSNHSENGKRSIIYQICQLCPGRLVTQSLLLFHVHQHAEETLCSMLRYVCEPCSVYVEYKEDFIDHKKSCDKVISKFTKNKNNDENEIIDTHIKLLPAQIPKKSVIKESSIKIKNYKSNNTINNNNDNKIKLNSNKNLSRPCHKCGTTMQPYKYKMLACFKCNKSLINKTLKKSNSSKNIQTKYLNGDCSDDSNSAIIKGKNEEHFKAELQLVTEHYECPVCKVSITDNYDTIKEHFGDHHKDVFISIEWCSSTYKQSITNILTCVNESDVDEVIISSKFTCNICQFQTDEEEEFREHVVTHRPGDSPAYQCMECGMCYVVKPSLEKHLLLTHKIRGVDEYLKESGQNHDEELGIEGPPLKENQCKVCYREFESPQELNSHLRTHGLAFLLNKRGSDLLRSP